jgi:hypothetical protein
MSVAISGAGRNVVPDIATLIRATTYTQASSWCDSTPFPKLRVDLPDVARSLFIAAANSPLNPSGKSKVESRHPVAHRGASAVVTNVGTGCGGRGSIGRARCSQGGVNLMSGYAAPDERRLNALAGNFGRQHMSPVGMLARGKLRTAKPCGPGTRGWCQADGDHLAQPGLDRSSIRQRWRQDEFVSRESAAPRDRNAMSNSNTHSGDRMACPARRFPAAPGRFPERARADNLPSFNYGI